MTIEKPLTEEEIENVRAALAQYQEAPYQRRMLATIDDLRAKLAAVEVELRARNAEVATLRHFNALRVAGAELPGRGRWG